MTPTANPEALNPDFWANTFSQGSAEKFAEATRDVIQMLHLLPDAPQNTLREALLSSPAQYSTALAQIWTETVFMVGGEDSHLALRRHSLSSDGTPDSRGDADSRYADLEYEARIRAPGVTSSSETASVETDLLVHPAQQPATEVPVLSLAELQAHWSLTDPHIRHTQLRTDGYTPAIATDCDGTIWRGDIAETLFNRALERRWFKAEAHPALRRLLESYGMSSSRDIHDDVKRLKEEFESGSLLRHALSTGRTLADLEIDYFAAMTWLFAGHSAWTIKQWTRDAFEEVGGFREQIHTTVVELLQTGTRCGFVPFAISASGQLMVEVGAAYLQIPPRRVRAVTVELQDMTLTSRMIPPITYGPGKVEALKHLIPSPAAIAIGDSEAKTDKAMLESAILGLVVRADPPTDSASYAHWSNNFRLLPI